MPKTAASPREISEALVTAYVQERYGVLLNSAIHRGRSEQGKLQELQELTDRSRSQLEQVAARLHRRDAGLWESHVFHPENKTLRKLFHQITGIKLPPTTKETQSTVAAYLAADHIQERITCARKETEASLAAMERERLLNLQIISEQMRMGHRISGQELLLMAQHYGESLHPSQTRALKNTVWGVLANSMYSSGNSFFCCSLYRRIQRIISESPDILC